jgi:hypothetical protein
MIDLSALLTKSYRARLVDVVAAFVDENYCGRSEMCIQYADLMDRALKYLNFPSRVVLGTAVYYSPDGDILHQWGHAWVRIGDEVIDANVDSIPENPQVPKQVRVAPYWGPIKETPRDRKLREQPELQMAPDEDVIQTWWPDLKVWLCNNRE